MVNREGKETVRVEVVYALPAEQVVLVLEVEGGTTVAEAIKRSGIVSRFPEIGSAPALVGIFGKRTTLSTPVRDGDRIELYRRLTAEPKAARRNRAQSGSTRKARRRRG